MAWLVLSECVSDAYDLGEDAGYAWGYEVGKEAGTMMCPRPFIKLKPG